MCPKQLLSGSSNESIVLMYFGNASRYSATMTENKNLYFDQKPNLTTPHSCISV